MDRRDKSTQRGPEADTTHLTMTPHISIVRVYDRPDGYAKRLPYLGALVVTHLTDTTIWVHTAVGKVTRGTYEKTLDMLREQGVTTLMAERHGHIKTIQIEHVVDQCLKANPMD